MPLLLTCFSLNTKHHKSSLKAIIKAFLKLGIIKCLLTVFLSVSVCKIAAEVTNVQYILY